MSPSAISPPSAASGPSVWKAADFAGDDSWFYPLPPSHVQAILDAARAWQGRDFASLEIADVNDKLGVMLPTMRRITADLGSRGFALIRGVPVEQLGDDMAALIYWAMGMLMGTGLSQNAHADFLCPVTDTGVDFGYSGTASQRNVRGYQSRADLNYHCDPTDIVGLLCLRQAKQGGASTIVSTPALYNEILREHPEHLPVLMRGFPYDRKGEEWPGEAPVTATIPVFVRHGERLSCRYARSYIIGGAQKRGVELTTAEKAALDCFDAVARRSDMALHMEFLPGDIQLLNNLTAVHGRTAYEDDSDPAKRRFLYRLWLQLGDQAPWNAEEEPMRWAFARFGNLGRTLGEWQAISAASATATGNRTS